MTPEMQTALAIQLENAADEVCDILTRNRAGQGKPGDFERCLAIWNEFQANRVDCAPEPDIFF